MNLTTSAPCVVILLFEWMVKGIDTQIESFFVSTHSNWEKAVPQVHQHHRFEALGMVEQLQTFCVEYASEILGCSLQATSSRTYNNRVKKLCMKEESHKLIKIIKNKIIRSRQPSTSYIVSNGGKSRWQLCDILVTMPQVNISTRKIKIHLVYQMIILRRKSLWTNLKPLRLRMVQGSAKQRTGKRHRNQVECKLETPQAPFGRGCYVHPKT